MTALRMLGNNSLCAAALALSLQTVMPASASHAAGQPAKEPPVVHGPIGGGSLAARSQGPAHVTTPTTHVAAPAAHVATPVSHALASVTHAVVPGERAVTSAADAVTAAARVASPAAHAATSAAHAATLAVHAATLAAHTAAPASHAVTPSAHPTMALAPEATPARGKAPTYGSIAAPVPSESGRDGAENRSAAEIFAASCATCHGSDGFGNHPSWVQPNWWAPRIAWGLGVRLPYAEDRYRELVRNGLYYEFYGFSQAMPAFGAQEISDEELDRLIVWLLYAPEIGGGSTWEEGVPPPPRPEGREIVVRILDEAPWFADDGTDARDPFGDPRRVVLSPGEYIKVVNTGKTWHTVTNFEMGFDTGYIGYSGNTVGQQTGYFYIEASDLPEGAHRYVCKLHPYMQLEIVTPGHDPAPLTHASKLPLRPPRHPGEGEVWLALQSYANESGPDGAVEIIDASDWSSERIAQVGNNPHNGWPGTAMDGDGTLRNVAVFADWHDVTVTVVDADARRLLGSAPLGAANAHVMTAPGVRDPVTGADRWFVTIMGSNKVQEVDPFASLAAGMQTLPALSQHEGGQGRPASTPHGLWFLDDGDHFLTANTLVGSASLYSISTPWEDAEGRSGIGLEQAAEPTGGRLPLAASILNTGRPNERSYRGFTNNAGTDDITLLDIIATPGAESLSKVTVPPPLGNSAGNLALTDLGSRPVRWAHMPIQCAVSPPDSTEHGRYMVVCNKASFNVSIVPLDEEGRPAGVYTFPAGLGAHGVAYGRKRTAAGRVAYYAYVSNSFENYVSVYDLELMEKMLRLERRGRAPGPFRPGGARESVLVEGHAARLLAGRDRAVVPVTLFSPDARGVVHVGDIPLGAVEGGTRSYLKEHVWIDLPGVGMTKLDLEVTTATGAMGVFTRPLPVPW